MQEVSDQVGVPVPTLYQWAAAGKWRLADLAEDAPPPGLPQRGDDAPAAEPPEPVPADPMAADPMNANPMKAGQQALARSIAAMEAGRLVQADRAARLAERFFALAVSDAGTPAAHPGATDEDDAPTTTRMEEARRCRAAFLERLLRHQNEAVETGNLPPAGQTFKEAVEERSFFGALGVGMFPTADDVPRHLETYQSMAAAMREDLLNKGLIPLDWYQKDEPVLSERFNDMIEHQRRLAEIHYWGACMVADAEGRPRPERTGAIFAPFERTTRRVEDEGEDDAAEATATGV